MIFLVSLQWNWQDAATHNYLSYFSLDDEFIDGRLWVRFPIIIIITIGYIFDASQHSFRWPLHCIVLPSSAVKFPWRNNFENMHTYFAQFHKHGCHDLIGFFSNESGAFRTLALGTKDFAWNYYQRLFRLYSFDI